MFLERLTADAKELLTEAFMTTDGATLTREILKPYIAPLGRSVDLDPLDQLLTDTMAAYSADHTTLDKKMGPRLHQRLSLTRREASDPGVWRFLSIAFRPDIVRARWGHTPSSLEGHFWTYTARPRPENNHFSRLWWIAELTHDNGNYDRTELAIEPRFKLLFRSQLGHYAPAVSACIDELKNAPQSQIETLIPALNRKLALLPLEALTAEDVKNLLCEES